MVVSTLREFPYGSRGKCGGYLPQAWQDSGAGSHDAR